MCQVSSSTSKIESVTRSPSKPGSSLGLDLSLLNGRDDQQLQDEASSKRTVLERRIRRRFPPRAPHAKQESSSILSQTASVSSSQHYNNSGNDSASERSLAASPSPSTASHCYNAEAQQQLVEAASTGGTSAPAPSCPPSIYSEPIVRRKSGLLDRLQLEKDDTQADRAADAELLEVDKRLERLIGKERTWAVQSRHISAGATTSSYSQKELSAMLHEDLTQRPSTDLQCAICLQTFASPQSKLRHAKRKHADNIEEAIKRIAPLDLTKPAAAFQCDVCYKPFPNSMLLSSHRRRHNAADKKFQCPHCPNRSYIMRSELKKHLKRTHGEGTAADQPEELQERSPPCERTYSYGVTANERVRVHISSPLAHAKPAESQSNSQRANNGKGNYRIYEHAHMQTSCSPSDEKLFEDMPDLL